MLKFVQLIGFFLIYLSASGQKVFFYRNATVEFNKFNHFFIQNSPLDVHDMASPYLKKSDLVINESKYFILYNEVSLKNLTILDGESENGTLLINMYEGMQFADLPNPPKGYKKKKIKSNHLIIDIINGADKSLIWRGWIELKKIKATDDYQLYQKAISLILLNFAIDPVISE